MIGVVIPTLNEQEFLPALLGDLRRLGTEVPLDVMVADGGSTDDTLACALRADARVLMAPRGRARQLNAGAAAVRGEWLFFVHADSRLDAAARLALITAVRPGSDVNAAVFGFAIDLPGRWKRMIELGQRVRETVARLPYGDQGLLVRRTVFQEVGGYPDIPVMEDVALIRRLRHHIRIRRLPAAVVTSGRRYLRGGVVRTWLRHSALIACYFAGISPWRLAQWRDATPSSSVQGGLHV